MKLRPLLIGNSRKPSALYCIKLAIKGDHPWRHFSATVGFIAFVCILHIHGAPLAILLAAGNNVLAKEAHNSGLERLAVIQMNDLDEATRHQLAQFAKDVGEGGTWIAFLGLLQAGAALILT